MKDRDQEVIREFLVESYENLARLDQELVELEKRPNDQALVGSIFRTIHTIKGTCGFLGFGNLEKIAHQTENLLSQLRDGRRTPEAVLTSLILEAVDATRRVLAEIEATGAETGEAPPDLLARLKAATEGNSEAPAQTPCAGATSEREVGAGEGEAAATPEENALRSSSVSDANIRVGVGLLDKLMDLVGELVLTRNQILQFTAEREDAALDATSQRLNLITSELQEGVMKTRMQPIGMVWNKLPRVVRDMAVALGKQIELDCDGADTELDRTIIEAIKDPLVHLVRNACDHGIEKPEVRTRSGKRLQGSLTLRAYHEGGQVNIEISDDGAGIDVATVKQKAIERGLLGPEQAAKMADREALGLIFHPGLTTANAITKVSGRGVGMDVVKSHIEKIGGVVEISSQPGQGTTVKLKIPLTLAIIPGLVITSQNQRSAPRVLSEWGERYVIPQVSLVELIRLEGAAGLAQIESLGGAPVYRRRGSLLPIAYLNDVLGLPAKRDSGVVTIVVLQAEDRQFGLVVDGISDTQEIVVKPLGKQFKGLNIYAGATIMGDGHVALILDIAGIGRRSGVLSEPQEQTRTTETEIAQTESTLQRLLLFRAGSFERLAIPLSLVARLEEIPRASIERASGRSVVQYRGRILPLVSLSALLEPGGAGSGDADPVQVIVFNDGERSIGLQVDQIVDVVEESVAVEQRNGRRGLLGSAVVGKRVVDLLDLNFVLRELGADWFSTAGKKRAERIVVADASAFSRNVLRGLLESAGYRVIEAGSTDEAVRHVDGARVDLVVASLDLPPSARGSLFKTLRMRPEAERIPVLGLTEGELEPTDGLSDSTATVPKFDRDAMLNSIARLAGAVRTAVPASQEVKSR